MVKRIEHHLTSYGILVNSTMNGSYEIRCWISSNVQYHTSKNVYPGDTDMNKIWLVNITPYWTFSYEYFCTVNVKTWCFSYQSSKTIHEYLMQKAFQKIPTDGFLLAIQLRCIKQRWTLVRRSKKNAAQANATRRGGYFRSIFVKINLLILATFLAFVCGEFAGVFTGLRDCTEQRYYRSFDDKLRVRIGLTQLASIY